MSESFQIEIQNACINISLDLHTGGEKMKAGLPMKLLCMGDFSNGKAKRILSERESIKVNKNNFSSMLNDLNPEINLAVKNTLEDDGSKENISLSLRDINDLEPEKSAHRIIQLKAIPAMCNLLRDFKSNLLDSVTFCKTLEKRLKAPYQSDNLHGDLNTLAPTLKY
ncbi:type VI secretion system contractile sheath small subunit [Klebsiella aerogenes]